MRRQLNVNQRAGGRANAPRRQTKTPAPGAAHGNRRLDPLPEALIELLPQLERKADAAPRIEAEALRALADLLTERLRLLVAVDPKAARVELLQYLEEVA